jgi:hypothetical protein
VTVRAELLLAHSITPGGPEIEVLVLAGALAYLGVYLFVKRATKPYVSVVLMVLALALGVGSFAVGRSAAISTSAAVLIRAPRDGQVVEARTPVELRAEVRGGRLVASTQAQDDNVGHLHVYVDEELVAMPTSDTYELELPPGRHTVTVEFTRADHASYTPRVTDEVSLTAR